MTDPFDITTSNLGAHHATPAARPIRRVESPIGGPVWVIASADLARQVLADPRITKDPGYAPTHWRTWELGLEPPGHEQPSLTTLDGEPHLRLRRAHATLFTARRLRAHVGRMEELARSQLDQAGSDLVADFTRRYPLSVICHVLGIPTENLDAMAAACQKLTSDDGEEIWTATVELTRLVTEAMNIPGSAAAELRSRLAGELTDQQVGYLLFGLVFAGQVTTESALGFVVAHYLGGHQGDVDDEAFVQDVLRRHPPAPFTLWRFTKERLELAGETLPPHSPVLAHIRGVNDSGADLTFGSGAHYCLGAQLAQLELMAVLRVLRTRYPAARLATPISDLPMQDTGMTGARLLRLPVLLGSKADDGFRP